MMDISNGEIISVCKTIPLWQKPCDASVNLIRQAPRGEAGRESFETDDSYHDASDKLKFSHRKCCHCLDSRTKICLAALAILLIVIILVGILLFLLWDYEEVHEEEKSEQIVTDNSLWFGNSSEWKNESMLNWTKLTDEDMENPNCPKSFVEDTNCIGKMNNTCVCYQDVCKHHPKFYQGTRAHTKSGTPCQHWDHHVPHKHQYHEHPETSENLCANPDMAPWPWCYTMDGDNRFEACFEFCENLVD